MRLLTRLVVGAYLLASVWDAVTTPAILAALTETVAAQGAPAAGFAVRVAVYAQIACGLAFIVGMVTRWAGLVCAVLFGVTAASVYGAAGLEAAMPAVLLVLIGLDMLVRGPGPLNLRTLLVKAR
ncbi:DoxX family protein [Phenylobacterium sp.]|uniref:DoxX family protein n=1 Tax=Phenylobacterium sp. TaxID=1871053 RepID=UPI0027318722|nr:DoxX family membrane protein [Phenylobacterium sp.]MDP1618130.1 DoxX family membrane protein [Phenylobacterium sp.]MDP1986517.1 DoxX family membrane protein [Phenylobacterium sp.]